jgi:hypothetical protein
LKGFIACTQPTPEHQPAKTPTIADLKQLDHSQIFGTAQHAFGTFGLMLRSQTLIILIKLPYLDILRASLPQSQIRNGAA